MPSRTLARRKTPHRARPAKRKITSLRVLSRIVRRAQSRGQQVVFTNGCFDLLHAGHVRIFERARRAGDLLILAVNSDRSVRALKGPGRPIVTQQGRALVLAALECVDYVTIFHEPTPERVIRRLRPNVLVKGGDWDTAQIVGRDLVERNGGRIIRVPLLKGFSTTTLIERIRQQG